MTVEINAAGTITGLQPNGISSQPVFPGQVLQVVQETTNVPVVVASTSYTDTGVTGTITPTSATSKILVTINQHTFLDRDSDDVDALLQLFRDTTSILDFPRFTSGLEINSSTKTKMGSLQTFSYLDSPSTTSAITYKTQGRVNTTANNGAVVYQSANTFSIITLMEIAG